MDIDALVWLSIPFLIMVIALVLAKARPSALKLSRRNKYAVAAVVTALVVVYAMWDLFFRQ